ncbi:MAG: hypothetical protein ACRDSE_02055 [Pseudonocardiaceae bacterium]
MSASADNNAGETMSEPPGWQQPDPEHARTVDPSGPSGPQWAPPPMPPTWNRPEAAKPGVIPLRPLNLGEILDGAISTMRAYPLVMLGVAAAVVGISQLIAVPLVSLLTDDLNRLGSAELLTQEDARALVGTGLAVTAIGVLVGLLARVFLTGFLTAVVGRAVLGQPAEFGEIWVSVRAALLRLLGLTMVYPLVAAIAFLPVGVLIAVLPPLGVVAAMALVVVAVWLYVLFSVATPALVLEDTGVWRAFGRSRQLVRGSWWRVFGVLALAAIIVFFIAAIIAIPFELLGGDMNALFTGQFAEITTTYLIVTAIGTVIASTITEPFAAGVTALLYLDQRMRREGLDIELARAAGAGPLP